MGIWALFLAVTTTFEMSKYALLKNGFVALYHTTESSKEHISIASSSLILNIGFTILFIILVLALAPLLGTFFKTRELTKLLYFYIPTSIILIPFSHLEYIQLANMTFKGIFASYFIRQGIFLLLVGIGILWFANTITLPSLVLFQTFGVLSGTLISHLYTKKYLTYTFNPQKVWSKKLMNYGKYVLGSGICSNIFGSLDRYLIASFMNPSSVAFYDVSARINNLIDVPTAAAADVIFPKSAKAANTEGPSKVKFFYEKMVSILIGTILPLSILVFLFAKEIVIFIAGQKYAPAVILIRIAMLYAFLRPVQIQASNVLNSINHPKTTFILNIVILSFTLTVDYICIKIFGFIGAAYGSFLTTIFSTILTFRYLKKLTSVRLIDILKMIPDFYRDLIFKSKSLLKVHPALVNTNSTNR